MAGRIARLVNEAILRRNLKRWRAVAGGADTLDAVSLRLLGAQARQLRSELDLVLAKAEGRLPPVAGDGAINRPGGTDWAWRPDLWARPVRPAALAPVAASQAISADAKMFHDCGLGEITLRQLPGQRGAGANHRVAVDVLGFSGSYLSLVVTLPAAGLKGLARRHVLRLEARLSVEQPIPVFARLNIRHGPNTAQMARELDLRASPALAEFDLGHSDFAEDRVEGAWIDLILEKPVMNRIVIADLTLSRGMRAEY